MKRKSVVTIIVVIIMIMLLQTSAFALTYTDVPTTHWAYIPIDRVTDLGFMSGVNGSFRRNWLLTREVAAEIFALLGGADLNSITQHPGFTDVTADSEYRAAIYWVKTNGIMSGTSSTQFSPYSVINRQEVCVALNKLKQVKNFQFETIASTPTFNDYNEISSWATTAVMNIASWGVIVGDNYGNINPKQDIERQEMAAMVYAFWDLSRYKRNYTTEPETSISQAIATKENEYNTVSDIISTMNAETVQNAAFVLINKWNKDGYNVAASMLLHYLQATGETYNFPLTSMIADTSTPQYDLYKNEVNDYRKAVETYIRNGNIELSLRSENYTLGRIIDSNNVNTGDLEGTDWFLAVNKYRYFSHTTATKNNNTFSATANYVLRDFYDFDPTSGGYFENLAFSQLDNLNKTGHARCYKVIGVHNTGNWTLGSRIY